MVEILVSVKTIENGYLVSIGQKDPYNSNYKWSRESYCDEIAKIGNTVTRFISDFETDRKNKANAKKVEKKTDKVN